jgi:hypothetical protein
MTCFEGTSTPKVAPMLGAQSENARRTEVRGRLAIAW